LEFECVKNLHIFTRIIVEILLNAVFIPFYLFSVKLVTPTQAGERKYSDSFIFSYFFSFPFFIFSPQMPLSVTDKSGV
jgi:hypothetical protein